jgi:YVTN family beta-propeller protein
MKKLGSAVLVLGWLIAAGAARAWADSSTSGAVLPGQQPDGSVLLPDQWSLRPAGRQVPLGDFPVNIAVHPEGRYAAVLHCGYGKHEIEVVDIANGTVVSRTPVHEAFYGLEFAPGGGRLYCSGSSDEVIHVFNFNNGKLSETTPIVMRDPKQRGIPCGMAVSDDASKLFVANLWGDSVSQVDAFQGARLLDIRFVPAGTHPANVANTFATRGPIDPDLQAITKRSEALLDPQTPDAPFPYACRLDDKRQRLYVSLWAQSCVAVIDLRNNGIIGFWPTGPHPSEMALTRSGRDLFVADANDNTVTVLDTATGNTVETLSTSLSPGALPGATPNSLALSPDEDQLFVANACNNDVAVFDVSTVGRSRSLGLIPVGWYPTSVRVTPDGRELLVANAKGLTSFADPKGTQPGRRRQPGDQYIGSLLRGALSIIDLPAKSRDFTRQLADYTKQAFQCQPQQTAGKPSPDNPVPVRPGNPGPIRYCIYIIKENRTYDQVLGDVSGGNGDPSLCLFPEKVTPNLHKLAQQFVLLDNFYVDAEVSADGHEWSMGAYASDFVQKTWRLNYGHARSTKFPYPSEGTFPIAWPSTGYIWDQAKAAGITYRSYGEFVHEGKTANDPDTTQMEALQGNFDPWYRCFDLGYPDAKRADRFISELKRFESAGDMPRLQIVRLPNDHTAGAVPGKLTPTALVADNDLAVGRVVEAVSHSKFWPQAAVFVIEDDAQNGPDHVDAHRTTAFVASPYTKHGAVDSTMYSTSSMLRTMELILGLDPMTQFDASAMPMFNSFQAAADTKPYDAVDENVDLGERNAATAWGGKVSRKMDFSREDATDEQQLNEIIWRSVRGADHPMPAPVHAAFVYARPKADGDDD